MISDCGIYIPLMVHESFLIAWQQASISGNQFPSRTSFFISFPGSNQFPWELPVVLGSFPSPRSYILLFYKKQRFPLIPGLFMILECKMLQGIYTGWEQRTYWPWQAVFHHGDKPMVLALYFKSNFRSELVVMGTPTYTFYLNRKMTLDFF